MRGKQDLYSDKRGGASTEDSTHSQNALCLNQPARLQDTLQALPILAGNLKRRIQHAGVA